MIEQECGDNFIKGFASAESKTTEAKNAVIKIHVINNDYIKWADYIFYTHRDIRDVAASLIRRTGKVPMKSKINDNIEAWSRYALIADLVIKYNRIISEPRKVIADIGKIIGIKPNINMIIKVLNKMKNSKLKKKDPITLMRINHITDGRSGVYKKHLEPNYLKWIEEKYKWWLVKNEYMGE